MEYLKLYHMNGHREKIAVGGWEEIKALTPSEIKRQNYGGDVYLELVGYMRGEHFKYASGSWRDIVSKMEGSMRKVMEADAVPHVVLAFGLMAWAAFVTTIMPLLGGV